VLTLFIIWSLPIALGFILLGFLVARAAKKRGKNPWLWGSLTVVLITGSVMATDTDMGQRIFFTGMAMKQLITPQGKITTLAEAKKITIRVSVDGVNFDVPLVYDFRGYNQQLHGWWVCRQGQIEGKERLSVDYVEVDALLPDISPMSEENLAQFEVLGWVKKYMSPLRTRDRGITSLKILSESCNANRIHGSAGVVTLLRPFR